MKKNVTALLLSGLLVLSIASFAQVPCNSVSDYDGHVYNAVQIGSQCWMKENMHVTHFPDGQEISSFENRSAATAYYFSPVGKPDAYVYGHLYDWKTATHDGVVSDGRMQGICPDGWHLPSAADWQQLFDFVESQPKCVCASTPTYIARSLAAQKAWIYKSACNCGVGKGSGANDATGFSAMPVGYYSSTHINFEHGAYFWSASQTGQLYAYYCGLYQQPTVIQGYMNKDVLLSVRCLRDDSAGGALDVSAVADEATAQPTSSVCPSKKFKEPAKFPGGQDALSRFLMENTHYPIPARDAAIMGIVRVQFVVEKDGTITDVHIIQGVCKELDDEAIRVVKSMPKFEPAINLEGEPDASILRLPFYFSFDSGNR